MTRRRFWTGLLDRARQRTSLHAAISPTDVSWLGASAGRSGLELNYSVTQHAGQVELYIDRGAQAANTAIFEQFAVREGEIDAMIRLERALRPHINSLQF